MNCIVAPPPAVAPGIKKLTDVDSDMMVLNVDVDDELKKFIAIPADAGVLSICRASAAFEVAEVTTTFPESAGISTLEDVEVEKLPPTSPTPDNVPLWYLLSVLENTKILSAPAITVVVVLVSSGSVSAKRV